MRLQLSDESKVTLKREDRTNPTGQTKTDYTLKKEKGFEGYRLIKAEHGVDVDHVMFTTTDLKALYLLLTTNEVAR
jgi:hypothetical protein